MPVYLLTDEIAFPPPTHAESDGLLAVGGDLGAGRLLLAYEIGVFPWYTEGQPILWWSPDPRIIFEPAQFSLSRRLRQKLRQKKFEVTFDRAFSEVIRACATVAREGQQGTWITGEMINAYTRLHEMGFAHSVESWLDGRLAGGIYGVSLGRCFFWGIDVLSRNRRLQSRPGRIVVSAQRMELRFSRRSGAESSSTAARRQGGSSGGIPQAIETGA